MKKAGYTFLFFLIAAFIIFWQLFLPIPTGYAAKNMCSAIFVAGMKKEFVKANDLDFSLVSMASCSVDYVNKSVRSTFLGLKPQVAVFRDDRCGCSLLGRNKEITSFESVEPSVVTQNDTLNWPYGTRQSVVSNPALNTDIDKILDSELAIGETGTRAIVVVHGGEIIGEKYAPPFDMNSLLLGWSMTKSITSTLVGIMVQEGMVDIEDPVPVEAWQEDERKSITWKNLLQMSSGLEWDEHYYWISDVTKMLYTKGDTYNWAVTAKLEDQPGTRWVYSSGTTNILSGLIRKTVGNDEVYHNFPYANLFNPINAGSFVMELDAAGNFIGSSYTYATARDWAKLGILYLNEGNWNGHQIFPQWWSEFVTTAAAGSEGEYGGHFWLHTKEKFKDVLDDLYFADGFQGQRVFILPSKKLVVVRLGLSKDEKADFNNFLSQIIAAVDSHS